MVSAEEKSWCLRFPFLTAFSQNLCRKASKFSLGFGILPDPLLFQAQLPPAVCLCSLEFFVLGSSDELMSGKHVNQILGIDP